MSQMSEEQEREFNTYLKKYEGSYRIKRGQDVCYSILCFPRKPFKDNTYNSIIPYSLADKDKLLLFSLFCSNRANTKNTLIKNIIKSGIWFKILQQGDTEVSLIFKEEDLSKLVKILKIQRRKVCTPEHIEKLRAGKNKVVKNG